MPGPSSVSAPSGSANSVTAVSVGTFQAMVSADSQYACALVRSPWMPPTTIRSSLVVEFHWNTTSMPLAGTVNAMFGPFCTPPWP